MMQLRRIFRTTRCNIETSTTEPGRDDPPVQVRLTERPEPNISCARFRLQETNCDVSSFHTCAEKTRSSSSERQRISMTDERRSNADKSSTASSSSPQVVVTTQENTDGSREKAMNIASVERAGSKRNENGVTIVLGFEKNSGMWQDPTWRSLSRKLQIKITAAEGDGEKVRWHGQTSREAMTNVTSSDNVASVIKTEK